tara:strand:- start:725 stop:901 length:177 start_codon:yes stop_codon:yes gene_type:complete
MKAMTLTETLVVMLISMVLTLCVIQAAFKVYDVIRAWRIEQDYKQTVPQQGIPNNHEY